VDDSDDPIQFSLDRATIELAVLQLATTIEPDGQFDPAEDPRPSAATTTLTALFGTVSNRAAAEGIYDALVRLWQWGQLGEPWAGQH
jgi:hypothetical protein